MCKDMNRQVRLPPEMDDALEALRNNLTYPELQKLLHHQAKLVVIDNEAWYIDMTGGANE